MGQDYCQDCGISIHSTTRVETGTATLKAFRFEISIHSTTRVETWQAGVLLLFSTISIHSTTRVETQARVYNALLVGFQSTPPRGWRRILGHAKSTTTLFQSTPPRGWRLFGHPYLYDVRGNFNPLHHEGGDIHHPAGAWSSLYFNPLHHEGGDILLPGRAERERYISIHSTTRVETHKRCKQ